jgi:Hypoxia induced protein conserved region
MSTLLNNSATIVAFFVFIVLAAGLINLIRTDSSNTSQLLMRWRVGLQFVAIVLVIASVLITKYA